MTGKIIKRDRLLAEDIEALFLGTAAAVRIDGYYMPSVCERLASLLSSSALRGVYENAPEIERVAQAYFECQASEELKERYAANSVAWMQSLRKTCDPILTPIDRVRLEMDEQWPAGAMLHNFGSTKGFAGLSRIFKEGSSAEPHQDVLPWDAPGDQHAEAIVEQLAMNLYLTLAGKGGELCLWERELSKDEYEAYRKPGSYGVLEEHIGPPDHVISPRQGELILFNARRVHSVRRIVEGTRQTWSSFIGRTAVDEPLRFWS